MGRRTSSSRSSSRASRRTRSAGPSTKCAETDLAAYLDASAIVKLIYDERESDALGSFLDSRPLTTSELSLAEVPRAIRGLHPEQPEHATVHFLARMELTLDDFDLLTIDREALIVAGSLEWPALRALDAIHVATALLVAPDVDYFVSYDHRQADAAAAAGFDVIQPGR